MKALLALPSRVSLLRLPWRCGFVLLLSVVLAGTATGQEKSELLFGTIQDPTFCPSNRSLVAYSRQTGDIQELYLYDVETGSIQQITAVRKPESDEEELGDFFGTDSEQQLRRFEGQLVWRPVLDPEGRQWFAFVSSASDIGYGLYLSYLTSEGELADRVVELPFKGQAGMPAWSPDGQELVFSGARPNAEGSELFLYRNLSRFLQAGGETRSDGNAVQLTENPVGNNFYPDWSPGGRYIAYQARTSPPDGGAPNLGISLLDIASWTNGGGGSKPRSIRISRQLSTENEYRPSWSPDGSRVAFYVSRSGTGEGENRKLDIGVLQLVRGSEGRVQKGRVLSGYTGPRLAQNVLPNQNRGPEWHPSKSTLSLIYVKKEADRGNPIYLGNVSQWARDNSNFEGRLSERFEENTDLHEEVAATRGPEGLRLAFASQVGGNLRLQVREVAPVVTGNRPPLKIPREVSRSSAMWRSVAFPGWGQLRKDQGGKALAFGIAGALTLATVGWTLIRDRTDYQDWRDKFWTGASRRAQLRQSRYSAAKTAKDLRVRYDNFWLRNAAAAAFAGIWAWSLYDSAQGFPYTVRQPVYAGESLRIERPRVGISPIDGRPTVRLSLSLSF